MSVQLFARRASYVIAGCGTYAAVAGLTYSFLTVGKEDQEETNRKLQNSNITSYLTRSDRNDRYNEICDCYDSEIDRDEFMMGINWLRKSLLYFHAKGNVLEVAAGTGRNVLYYPKQYVNRVVLMDRSEQMLSQARKKVESAKKIEGNTNKIQYAFVVADSADLNSLKIPSNTFDTVVDTFGLCSYVDPVAALKEMGRVCKKDGKILLLEHGRSKSWSWITNYLDKHAERHAKNWGCVWNRDLDCILKESGLVIDHIHTWHFGTTYYMVCRPAPTEQE